MNLRVLVVDDTRTIRDLLTRCLTYEGMDVCAASDGQEALSLLQNQTFDLMFLDIKMPGMSGTEVLRNMRARGLSLPVIIITAYATVKNAVECTQLGAVAYLQKPFTADKVRHVLSELHSGTMPDTPVVAQLLSQARLRMTQGMRSEAEGLLRQAIAASPLEPEVYNLFAELSHLQQRPLDAAKYRLLAQSLTDTSLKGTL